jgi:hypothetical protein
MMRRIVGVRAAAGLTLLGAMLAGGQEAWAGGLASTITISGGIVQGPGDPQYIYQMSVSLVNGSMSYPGSGPATSFFTIDDLVGVTPQGFPIGSDSGSLTTQQNFPPAVIWQPGISLTSAAAPYAADVSWSFKGNSTLSTSGILPLGEFTVQTSQMFPAGQPPIPVGSTIHYTFTINDSSGAPTSGSGTFILQQGTIPEPSSMILLLAGAGGMPLVILHERRRARRAA